MKVAVPKANAEAPVGREEVIGGNSGVVNDNGIADSTNTVQFTNEAATPRHILPYTVLLKHQPCPAGKAWLFDLDTQYA